MQSQAYLSHNGIEAIAPESFAGLTKLNTLDLGVNRIKCMDHLAHLTALTDLWMNNNEIAAFEEIEQLVPLGKLETLYLEHCPLYGDFEYRMKIAKVLPTLEQIDVGARQNGFSRGG